jgi:hypothetical protein
MSVEINFDINISFFPANPEHLKFLLQREILPLSINYAKGDIILQQLLANHCNQIAFTAPALTYYTGSSGNQFLGVYNYIFST